LRLPELDGCQLLEALRSEPGTAGIPVVLVTASADPDTRERIRASGFAEFLTKPFDLGELRAAIARILRE
jgi:CheY-like chemotaxis protein